MSDDTHASSWSPEPATSPALSDPEYDTSPDPGRRISRRWWIALALAALALAVGIGLAVRGGESSEEQSERLAAEGLKAVNAGNWARARELYREAAETNPDNPFAQYNLGLIAQTRDLDLKAAESFYRRTLAIDPEFGGALYNLAIVRTSAGGVDEAILLYRRAITAHPDFADAFLNLGLLLKKNPATAAEGDSMLRKAAELDPSLKDRVTSEMTTTTVASRSASN